MQDNGTSYARMYDLSRSQPDEICKLASQILIGGGSLETVNELLLLASRQKPQKGRVGRILQQTFKVVLGCLRCVYFPNDTSWVVFLLTLFLLFLPSRFSNFSFLYFCLIDVTGF